MIYELRYHETAAAPQRTPLHRLFANHEVRLLQKHGIGIIAYWQPWIGDRFLIPSLLGFENMAERESRMNAFEADPEWREAVAEANSGAYGPLVNRVHNTLLRLTPYSPEPKINGNVQQFQMNEAMPGRISDLHHLFEHNHNAGLFAKHDIGIVGWWSEVAGISDRVFFILDFPSLAAEETAFHNLQSDPEFNNAASPYETQSFLRKKVWNSLQMVTDYTPRGQYVSAPTERVFYGYEKGRAPG